MAIFAESIEDRSIQIRWAFKIRKYLRKILLDHHHVFLPGRTVEVATL